VPFVSPSPPPDVAAARRLPPLAEGALGAERRWAATAATGATLALGGSLTGVPTAGLTATVETAGTMSTAGAMGTSGILMPSVLGDHVSLAGYDTVVCVSTLCRAERPADLLAAVFALLVPGGRLLVVEPERRPGWRAAIGRASAPLLRARWGVDPTLAVSQLALAAGFSPISVERITMPTFVPALRWFCRLVLERPLDGVATAASGARA